MNGARLCYNSWHMLRTVNLWIGSLFCVLLAATCGGGLSVISMEVGDCFDDPAGQATEVSEVDEVPCSESHDNEVYAVADHPAGDDAPYPGDEALEVYGIGYCLSEFENYVGISYEESRLDFTYLLPVRDGWEGDDDRGFVCFLYDLNFAKLTGSMEGSRE